MNNRSVLALVATGTLLAIPPSAAQQWGRGPVPKTGACFYEDPQFRGPYFCAGAGDDLPFIPDDMHDRISSIRVFGGAQAVIYSWNRFDGREGWFNYDVPDLRYVGWDDRISSLRIGRRSDRDRWDQRLFEGRPRDDEGSPRDYEGRPREYEGRPRDYSEGTPRDQRDHYENQVSPREQPGSRAQPNMPASAAVDAIIRRAYQDLLRRDPDPGGLQQYRDRMMKDGWSDAQVRESIMQSPEYHADTTMTPQKAQAVVRAAYLSVLKREPDPGSAGYVDHVLKDHWSQQDVERELRNSEEYRAKSR